MIRIVCAAGRSLYAVVSVESGSNLKGMVFSLATSWPVVVVAAKVMLEDLRRGIRNSDVQPAPRMRRSTGFILRVMVDR